MSSPDDDVLAAQAQRRKRKIRCRLEDIVSYGTGVVAKLERETLQTFTKRGVKPVLQGGDISRPTGFAECQPCGTQPVHTRRNVKRQQGYVFRLTPNAAQDTLLRQFVGCSRLVWNAVLSENEFRYATGDPLPIGRKSFCARLLDLKATFPFLKDAHSQPLQQTLNDLVKAYKRAFDPKLAAALTTFKKK